MFAEYALVLAILCGCLACGAFYFGDAISQALTDAGRLIAGEWEGIKSGEPISRARSDKTVLANFA